ncbi:MAG TPA: CBS domain-containing protein [Pseudonocardia sp.]|nr:CBS domain-containing protein [Pseudonocardia sp.]
MTTARDLMTPDPRRVRSSEPVLAAAVAMAEAGVGALPVCGEDDRLTGMITDRDIVVSVLAAGKDPRAVHVGELAGGSPVTIGADDDVADLLRTMVDHRVRRLPVVDGDRLVGLVAVADVARHCDDDQVGLLLEALSAE